MATSSDTHVENAIPSTECRPPMFEFETLMRRGIYIGMLMIMRPNDDHDARWVIMTEQSRIPAGKLPFLEIPTGSIDKQTEDFQVEGRLCNSIEEETGMKINQSHLLDMTKLALRGSPNQGILKAAMYLNPGGSGEFIALFSHLRHLDSLVLVRRTHNSTMCSTCLHASFSIASCG